MYTKELLHQDASIIGLESNQWPQNWNQIESWGDKRFPPLKTSHFNLNSKPGCVRKHSNLCLFWTQREHKTFRNLHLKKINNESLKWSNTDMSIRMQGHQQVWLSRILKSPAEKAIHNVIKTLLSSTEINLLNMSQLYDNFTVTVLFLHCNKAITWQRLQYILMRGVELLLDY